MSLYAVHHTIFIRSAASNETEWIFCLPKLLPKFQALISLGKQLEIPYRNSCKLHGIGVIINPSLQTRSHGFWS
jgi:hypothetical protein